VLRGADGEPQPRAAEEPGAEGVEELTAPVPLGVRRQAEAKARCHELDVEPAAGERRRERVVVRDRERSRVDERDAHRPTVIAPVSLLVRTWNLFHGRTSPPSSALHLEEMVRTVVEDGPDVVAFQEVPVWALDRLEAWSGMTAVPAVAMLPLGGLLARKLTEWKPQRFRSLLTGQGNALLLSRRLELVGRPRIIRLNPGPFRSAEARARGLSLRERLDWAWNRRVCQAVHVRERKRVILLANLHATKDHSLAAAEVDRLARLWPPEAPTILCGDFNARGHSLPGFSEPLEGVDQILVRGLEFERGPSRWPVERRRTEDGALLSDHAPVEAVVA
jgi:hypothetical protein